MAETKPSRRKTAQANLDNLGLEIGNKPPQALEVEEAVLGAMLLEPAIVDAAMAEINRDESLADFAAAIREFYTEETGNLVVSAAPEEIFWVMMKQ